MPPGAQGPQAAPPTQASIEAAAKVLAESRQALGGDAKLNGVKNFVVTGRTRRVTGDNLVPIEFEIDVELPDKYVRKDEVPAREEAPSSSGFNGDALIQIPPPAPPPAAPAGAAGRGGEAPAPAGRGATPPAGGQAAAPATPPAGGQAAAPAGARAGGPPAQAGEGPARGPGPGAPGGPAGPAGRGAANPTAARVLTLKQDFARLTLGLFAASFPSYPLTFAHAGKAEAPQGTAEVIDVRGAGNFMLRLFINSETHLPVMVSWQTPLTPANIILLAPGQTAPATLPPGGVVVNAPAPPAATATQEEKDKYARDIQALRQKTMAERRLENRIYYADYRDNDGLKWPFRLRRAIGADTIEETTFDRFKLNTKIDAKKFEPVK